MLPEYTSNIILKESDPKDFVSLIEYWEYALADPIAKVKMCSKKCVRALGKVLGSEKEALSFIEAGLEEGSDMFPFEDAFVIKKKKKARGMGF